MKHTGDTTGILRGDVRLLRGETLLLFDPGSDAYYKISERFANIISFFSEDISYEAMQEKLRINGIETTLEELHEISSFLRANTLLIPRYGETALRREQLEIQKKKTLFSRIFASYLFLKFPPVHPEKFFKKISPAASLLASPVSLLLWSIPALAGYVLALRDSGKIIEQFSNTLSWAGLVKYFFAIVVIKLLHEFAHSIAAMRFNCRVRGIGVGLVFFIPRLYTDTTDSWKLPRKQRLLIDGAGIIAELIIGGIAALFWNILPPGSGKSTMFYIFAVSTLSTLLVNGNIFIRYDGYYILSDILGIENLMRRSMECLRQTWRYCFLRLGSPSSEKCRGLLICYGISALIYRIFLYTSICLMIYYNFAKASAAVMLVLEIYTLLLQPMIREIRTVWQLSRKSGNKTVLFMLFLIIMIICGVLFIPLSWSMTLPGETVPAQKTSVTVKESGYLSKAVLSEEKDVTPGTVIAELTSPQLEYSIEKIRRTMAYDKELFIQQELDEKEFSQREVTAQKRNSDKLALQELLRRKDNLTIKSFQDGSFIPRLPAFSSGAFLKRNTVIGEIVSPENTIYAYADDDQIGKIYSGQKGTATFSDRLPGLPCIVTRIDPVAVKFKPSPVLQPFGGPIAVYQKGESEFLPIQTLYRIELKMTDDFQTNSGRLVKVKLSSGGQLYTYVKKLVLSFFRKEF